MDNIWHWRYAHVMLANLLICVPIFTLIFALKPVEGSLTGVCVLANIAFTWWLARLQWRWHARLDQEDLPPKS